MISEREERFDLLRWVIMLATAIINGDRVAQDLAQIALKKFGHRADFTQKREKCFPPC